MNKKYFDFTWDFIGSDTKTFTHCFHNYPAMMMTQIAERLILKYGNNANLLFDPYCGTGTSLVEAILKNINAVGTDLNPLARLISKAKTTSIDFAILNSYLKDFDNYLHSTIPNIDKINNVIINIKNIDYWFSQSVQERLFLIKKFINNISDNTIADFFKVSFSETIRECSWTRNNEFKMYRIPEDKLQKFNPNVYGLMQKKLIRNKTGLGELFKRDIKSVCRIFDFNTIDNIKPIENESVDIIVTSPPYGDSRTTVAYGQFSRLSNEWLDIEDAAQIDNKLMGGIKNKNQSSFINFDLLNQIIYRIAEKDEKRSYDVISFYNDYQKSINNVAKTVKKGGFVCYVVGNRKVKGIDLPTDEITKFLFENNGYEHIETIIRNITNKRMPFRNSPSNIIGKTDMTMKNEYIVVMRKI